METVEILQSARNVLLIPKSDLQRNIWVGNWAKSASDTGCLRGLCWRLMLGVLRDGGGFEDWVEELRLSVDTYNKLKMDSMPKIEAVDADPLSGGGAESAEWKTYYKNMDLINFIKGDLTRLYMTGIEDEYFEEPRRRDIILNVLFVWAAQHPTTSYRQGMHEIAGPILFVLEEEQRAFGSAGLERSHALSGSFTDSTLEAHTYWIFEKVMNDLEPLYDPSTLLPIRIYAYPLLLRNNLYFASLRSGTLRRPATNSPFLRESARKPSAPAGSTSVRPLRAELCAVAAIWYALGAPHTRTRVPLHR